MSNRHILEVPKVVILLLVVLFADDTSQYGTRRKATADDGSFQNFNLIYAVPTDVEGGKINRIQNKRSAESDEEIILNLSSGRNYGKCKALQKVGVNVTCKHLNANINCNQKIPSGSTARATCQMGYKEIDPVYLNCVDGEWDYNLPKCTIDCGRTSGFGKTSKSRWEKAAANGFPWHVGIYELSEEGYEQICGGTILTEKIVISAAHCFWVDQQTLQQKPGLKDPQLYSVVAGKTYRPYENTEDTAQITKIEKILIPDKYFGRTFMQKADIALLILTNPLKFAREVLPICFNMQKKFVRHQLQEGRYGTGVGWGLRVDGGNPSEQLLYANLTFISKDNCIKDMPDSFQRYITTDKICAGYLGENPSMCIGDTGGGLVFSSTHGHINRYYIQGIVSVGVPDETGTTCAAGYYTTFTKIEKYKDWINEQLAKYKS